MYRNPSTSHVTRQCFATRDLCAVRRAPAPIIDASDTPCLACVLYSYNRLALLPRARTEWPVFVPNTGAVSYRISARSMIESGDPPLIILLNTSCRRCRSVESKECTQAACIPRQDAHTVTTVNPNSLVRTGGTSREPVAFE